MTDRELKEYLAKSKQDSRGLRLVAWSNILSAITLTFLGNDSMAAITLLVLASFWAGLIQFMEWERSKIIREFGQQKGPDTP